jgi:hypothetical protein
MNYILRLVRRQAFTPNGLSERSLAWWMRVEKSQRYSKGLKRLKGLKSLNYLGAGGADSSPPMAGGVDGHAGACHHAVTFASLSLIVAQCLIRTCHVAPSLSSDR